MENKYRIYITSLLILCFAALMPCGIYAQKEKKYVFEGNKNYTDKKYPEAEKSYKLGLNKNKNSYKSAYNLGDAYYKQEKYEEAAEQFQALTHRASSKDTLSKVYHNLGNSFLKSKKYKESIDAYKNALKNNPNDEDTRYNLACAQQYLKQQQQQKDKDKKDDKKDQDKKDDKKDEQKKDQEKKDKEKENKDRQDQKKPEDQKNKISKKDAQRLLDALQNDEKNLQNKAKKGQPGMKVQIEKDW